MSIIKKTYQTLLVFQQGKKAEPKVRWIRKHGKNFFDVNLISVTSNLPSIIDNSYEYLPRNIKADLVLDYLDHLDLSNDLVESCIKNNIPIISSGNKISLGKKHYTPAVCCALPKSIELGNYGEYFGKPEINVIVNNDKIAKIEVLHGSPCGSTWKAAKKIIGIPLENAATQFALNTQYFCTANPANWDPISGESPVHIAAELHKNALIKAIKNH